MAAPEPSQMEVSKMNFPQIYVAQAQDCASSSSQPPPPFISSQPPPPRTPISSGFPATLQLPSTTPSSPSTSSLPEHLKHKNRLQEFTQRSNIPLPMYQTVNEGTQHAPKFRSTVWVDGMSYTSKVTFHQRKAAEQDVARVALECLSKKIKDEGFPLVCENTLFSKSILNEYATKLNMDRPTYSTVQQEGLLPLFVSSLVFNGTRYTGDAARSKKEAEQLAARAVILSILDAGNSGSEKLYEIIKSKSKIYAAVKPNNQQCIDASKLSAIANTGHASGAQDHEDKEIAGPVAASNNETKVELPEPSKMLSSCQESWMPKQEQPPEATKLPNASIQPGSEQPIGDGSSSRKRRRNKKKANKKARLESQSPIAASSLNEVPPCSVAQKEFKSVILEILPHVLTEKM